MPKQPQLFAQITALLVAQDAFQDNRGRTHVIGIFDTVGAPKFPVNIGFMVYLAVKGEGSHTVVVKMEDSLGDKILQADPMVAEVTPQKGHQIFMRIGATIKSAGLYKVIAFLDGVKEIEHPLFVREEAKPSIEPQGV